MRRSGQAHILSDAIDTDQIFPAQYLHLDDRKAFGDHALEGYSDDYPEKLSDGDVIVAGSNFGLGSSRESAPIALKYAGVASVVAESFARIFYRNSINVGLPIAEVPDITDHVEDEDVITVDFSRGVVKNETTEQTFDFPTLPPELREILESGGVGPEP